MFFFTPLRGFYFTFPSLYFFTIGHSGVFSLTRWSSQIHTGFHVPPATRDVSKFKNCRLLDFHHLWCRIQLLRLSFFRALSPPKKEGNEIAKFLYTKSFLIIKTFDDQKNSRKKILDSHNPTNSAKNGWFRLFPFRSPLLRESLLLSFPLATEMFQFTRLPLPFL